MYQDEFWQLVLKHPRGSGVVYTPLIFTNVNQTLNKFAPSRFTDPAVLAKCRRDVAVGTVAHYFQVMGVRTPVEARDFSLHQNVRTGSDAHPSTYSKGTAVKWPCREAEHSPQSSAELGMSGAMLLLPLYAFMAWTARCSRRVYEATSPTSV